MNKNSLLLIGTFCFGLGMSSCIDNSYDLDDIDTTLGIQTDLTLPTSSLDEIQLKNIMNLEEDGVVQRVPNPDNPEEDTMYVVRQSGNANVDPIKIDEIRINKPVVNDFDSEVKLDGLFTSPKFMSKHNPSRNYRPIKINGIDFDFQDFTYRYTIGKDDAVQQIESTTTENISPDVVDIKRIGIKAVDVTLTINTDFPEYLPVHLDNFTLTYPKELNITSCYFEDTKAEIDNGRIYITTEKDIARPISEITLKLTIEGVETGNNFTFENNSVTLSGGTIKVDGTFRIETADLVDNEKIVQIIEDKWNADPSIIDPLNPQVDLFAIRIIPGAINIKGVTTFSDDLVVTHVTGTFQHAIEGIEPLSLSDLPEFLMDNEEEGRKVVLDLDNPMIFLSITNSLPANINTKLTLKSDTDGDTLRSTGPLTIMGNTINKYYLAEKEDNKYLPEEHKTAKWEKVEGLSNLIKRIPKEITVDVATVTLEAEDLDITQEYLIDIEYDVYAPLIFGKDFKLMYTDTDKGWDLGDDYDYLDAECILLTGNISSTLPASMTLKLDLWSVENRKIEIVEDNEIHCKANTQKTPFELKIKAKPGYSLKEILAPGVNQLDGIRYCAILDDPIEGQPLQDNAEIKIDNIKLTLQGLVTIEIED